MVRKAYEYEEFEFPNRIYFWNHNRFELYDVNNDKYVGTFNTKNVKRKYNLDRINKDMTTLSYYHAYRFCCLR